MALGRGTAGLLTLALGLAWVGPACAESSPAGVVTHVVGTVTVARVSLPEPAPLKFRDTVFTSDRIITGDRSFARVLLGGKALVTARERSVLIITTVPGTATIEALSGKFAVAVAKSLNPSGETIAIKSRNAVVAVRGTVVVAQVMPGAAVDGSRDLTTFTVLRGAVDVQPLNPVSGQLGAVQRLGALQSFNVTGIDIPRMATITPVQAKQMGAEFGIPLPRADAQVETAAASVAKTHVGKAAQLIETLVGGAAGTPDPSSAKARTDASRTAGSPTAGDEVMSGTRETNTLQTAPSTYTAPTTYTAPSTFQTAPTTTFQTAPTNTIQMAPTTFQMAPTTTYQDTSGMIKPAISPSQTTTTTTTTDGH
jgi:hypothetical protein